MQVSLLYTGIYKYLDFLRFFKDMLASSRGRSLEESDNVDSDWSSCSALLLILNQIKWADYANFSSQMKICQFFLPMLTSVILSLPLWRNKTAELTCLPVHEQGWGNGATGSWARQDLELRTKERKKEVGSSCAEAEIWTSLSFLILVLWWGFWGCYPPQ